MRCAEELSGGDRRSLGRTAGVVERVLADADLLPELFDCLFVDDEVVRMRAGDALEKVATQRPHWLTPYLDRLLDEVAAIDQPSIQWHVAQILGEVPLDRGQRRRAVRLLQNQLEDATDWIVLTSAMEAMTNLALRPDAEGDEDTEDTEDAAHLRQWLILALRRRQQDPRRAVAKRATKQLARLHAT